MGKKLDSLVDLVISKNDDYSNLEDGNKLLVKKKLKSEILYEIKQEVTSKKKRKKILMIIWLRRN